MVQGEAATYIDVNIRSEKLEKDASKAADSFSKRIEKAVSHTLGAYKPIEGGSSSGGGSAIATGVAAGLAAGGVIALLDILVKTLADFPIISGIMKMFKVILTLLLMPLVPILKPVLMALGEFVKFMAPVMFALQKGVEKIMSGDIFGGLKDIDRVLSNAVRDVAFFLAEAVLKIYDSIKSTVVDAISNIFNNLLAGAMDIGAYIWEKLKEAWTWGLDLSGKIWHELKNTWTWALDIGGKAWKTLKDSWTWTLDIGSKVWDALNSAWTWTLNIADKIWEQIKSAWTWGLDIASKLWEWIQSNLINILGGDGTSVKDAIITPSGVVHTDPQDYIIATKNPQSLGGNKSITINVTGNTFGNRQDIDYLTREITRNFRAEMRASGR